MKQSEKDKIYELIENCKTGDVVLGRENYSVINMTVLSKYINNLPTEPDDITEVYAIRDCITGETHWNAHGCPYKYKDDAEKKIHTLMKEKCFGEPRVFTLLTFKLDVK